MGMSVWSVGMVKWEINDRMEFSPMKRSGRCLVGDNSKASEGQHHRPSIWGKLHNIFKFIPAHDTILACSYAWIEQTAIFCTTTHKYEYITSNPKSTPTTSPCSLRLLSLAGHLSLHAHISISCGCYMNPLNTPNTW
jgi:hypothetical protein